MQLRIPSRLLVASSSRQSTKRFRLLTKRTSTRPLSFLHVGQIVGGVDKLPHYRLSSDVQPVFPVLVLP